MQHQSNSIQLLLHDFEHVILFIAWRVMPNSWQGGCEDRWSRIVFSRIFWTKTPSTSSFDVQKMPISLQQFCEVSKLRRILPAQLGTVSWLRFSPGNVVKLDRNLHMSYHIIYYIMFIYHKYPLEVSDSFTYSTSSSSRTLPMWAIAQVLCCQVTSGKLLGQEWRTFIQVAFVVGCGASKKSIWFRKILDMDMLITCCYMWQVTSQVKNANVHAFAMDFL